jgi:hypothetical protein
MAKFAQKDLETYLTILEKTPELFLEQTRGLPEKKLRVTHKDAWSLLQLLAHLRACAEVWGDSVLMMLALDQPVLPEIHPNDWWRVGSYEAMTFAASLRLFSLNRKAFLLVLRSLPQEAWQRSALIKGREHTVYSQVRRTALHEEHHWPQIEAKIKVLLMEHSAKSFVNP